MANETRLETLYRYRNEAMLSPKENKLYLEDLALSIEAEKWKPIYDLVVMHGFELNKE
jgi:hypothetical protein